MRITEVSEGREGIISMILGASIVIVVGLLIFNYFRVYKPEMEENKICSKIVALEGVRDIVHIYKLENGTRVESIDLYQDGDVFCYTP